MSQHPHRSFCSLGLLFLLLRLSFTEASHLLTQPFRLGFSPWSILVTAPGSTLPSLLSLISLARRLHPLNPTLRHLYIRPGIGEWGEKPHIATDWLPSKFWIPSLMQSLRAIQRSDSGLQPASSPLVCDDSFVLVFSKLPRACLSFIFARWPFLLRWKKKVFRCKLWPVHQQVCSRSICPISFSSLALREASLPLPVRDWSLLFHSGH